MTSQIDRRRLDGGVCLLVFRQFVFKLVDYEVRYRFRHPAPGVDVCAKGRHGFLRIPYLGHLCHSAESAFLVSARPAGLVIPAKHPHVRAAFAFQLQDTSAGLPFALGSFVLRVCRSPDSVLKLSCASVIEKPLK